VSKDEKKYEQKAEKSEKTLETSIHFETFVYSTSPSAWKQVFEYFMKSGAGSGVSATQMDILKKRSLGSLQFPTDKQSKILYDLVQKAKTEGLVISD